MADTPRETASAPRAHADPEVPKDLARALDASNEDVRLDRTADIGEFLRCMEAKLDAYRARKAMQQC